MIDIDIEKCNGCGACANICPRNAIKMQSDSKGFLYPVIDKKLCVNCGLCNRACSLIYDFSNKPQNQVIAGFTSDETRLQSSSGGIFSVFAEFILENNGYVAGAAFDDDFSVKHIIIDDKKDLWKLRTSKYVQSKIGSVYKEIKQILDSDKTVLFSGTPCQCAALKGVLGKNYDNLYCIDIVCTGVPSFKVLKKYYEELCSPDEKIQSVNFRGKQHGWNYDFCLNVKTDENTYETPFSKCSYLTCFNEGLSIRNACYNCKFAKQQRVGDITLGDFWEIEQFDKTLNDKKGISLLTINNNYGQTLFDKVKNNASFKPIEVPELSLIQPRLFYPTEPHANKNKFWDNVDKLTLTENVSSCLTSKYDCAIYNFWWASNYGAILTAYALQQLIENMGYSSVLIKYIYGQNPNAYYNKLSDKFARKYLKTTKLFPTEKSLKELNSITDKFIVGSDQVFRYDYMQDSCMLNFANYDKTKIAFSASFGIDKFNCKKKDINKYKFLISRFDDISVREVSGVDLCKNTFQLDVSQIIDPVFAIDKEQYESIIKNSTRTDKKYLLSYILDKDEAIQSKIKQTAEKNDITVIEINNETVSVEDWLYLIKNAEIVLTDSFHGACFSLIFNKQFQCLLNTSRGQDRFDTLMELFKIPANVFLDKTAFLSDVNIVSLDYKNINSLISQYADKCKERIKYIMALHKTFDSKNEKQDEKLFKKYYKVKHIYKFKKMLYHVLGLITCGSTKRKFKDKYKKYKQLCRSGF